MLLYLSTFTKLTKNNIQKDVFCIFFKSTQICQLSVYIHAYTVDVLYRMPKLQVIITLSEKNINISEMSHIDARRGQGLFRRLSQGTFCGGGWVPGSAWNGEAELDGADEDPANEPQSDVASPSGAGAGLGAGRQTGDSLDGLRHGAGGRGGGGGVCKQRLHSVGRHQV